MGQLMAIPKNNFANCFENYVRSQRKYFEENKATLVIKQYGGYYFSLILNGWILSKQTSHSLFLVKKSYTANQFVFLKELFSLTSMKL